MKPVKKSVFTPLFYGTSAGKTQKFNTLVNGGYVHWTEPEAQNKITEIQRFT
jgi:hypothetical protein